VHAAARAHRAARRGQRRTHRGGVAMRSQRLESARLVGRIVGPSAVLMVYAGYASHGHRSGYERVPTYWWEVYQGSKLITAKQYSGRRIHTLIADFDEVAADSSPELFVDQPLRLLPEPLGRHELVKP